MTKENKLICILGPTASGKTKLGVKLAHEFSGEIISADSRQVYRGLDIGSGKDLSEYIVDGKRVPYHLIDMIDPQEEYNVFQFQSDFLRLYDDIQKKEKLSILVGGTGLYLDAILNGYKLIEVPENISLRDELSDLSLSELIAKLNPLKTLHNQTDITDKERAIRAIEIAQYEKEHPDLKHDFPDIESIIFGLEWEPEALRKRIEKRLEERLKEGMIDEVQDLLKRGVTHERLIRFGLEYKWCAQFLSQEITYDALVQGLSQAIGKFAKRQRTWFRRMEKMGKKINWIKGNLSLQDQQEKIISIMSIMEGK